MDIKKFFRIYHAHSHISINISDTFPIKTRCKFCGTKPNINNTNYIYREKNSTKKNPVKNYAHWNARIFLKKKGIDPIYNGIHRVRVVPYNVYNVSYHKNDPKIKYKHLDFLFCDCTQTAWAFSGKTISKFEYNIQKQNRKSKKYY